MRYAILLTLALCSIPCFPEGTKVSVESKSEMDFYQVVKFGSEDSESLFPSRKFDSSNLSLLGKTPLEFTAENGVRFYNIGGNNRYSRTFSVVASGSDVKVLVTGDFAKVRRDGLWALGLALGSVLSLSTVKLINDQMPADRNYVGFLLPIAVGCGFCYEFGKWVYDMPRVKVVYE